MLFTARYRRAEVYIKSLLALITSLRSDVWGIINYDAEMLRRNTRHSSVVADEISFVLWINVHRHDRAR